MNRPLHILLRLLRVVLGLVLGLFVATAIVVIIGSNKGSLPDFLAGMGFIGFVAFQAAHLLWPLLALAVMSEGCRWRSALLPLGVGLGVGLAMLAYVWIDAPVEPPDPMLGEEPVLTAAKIIAALGGGLAGGLVYWLIAGRTAGFTRTERPIP